HCPAPMRCLASSGVCRRRPAPMVGPFHRNTCEGDAVVARTVGARAARVKRSHILRLPPTETRRGANNGRQSRSATRSTPPMDAHANASHAAVPGEPFGDLITGVRVPTAEIDEMAATTRTFRPDVGLGGKRG